MAQTTLILSSSSVSITSSNNRGNIYLDSSIDKYIATRAYSQKSNSIQASLPSNLSNITVTSVSITQQFTHSGGTAWRYTTNENIKEQLNSGIVNFPISFIYAPSGDGPQEFATAGQAQSWANAGANSKTCTVSNITVTIEYTEAESSTTQRISYKLSQTSIAYQEYLGLQVEYIPTSTITAGTLKAKVYNATVNKEISYVLNTGQALAANTFYSFSLTSQLFDTITSNLTTGNKIKIYIEGATDPIIDEALSNFIFVSARTAPNLTLTWDNSTYLSYIQAPIVTLSNITLDSTTDAALKSVVINFSNSELGQITLLPNAGVQEISPFIVSSDISNPSYTITITDSYNQTTINSITPTNLTIKLYEPPSFADNFNIKRYVFNSLTNLNEITSDGTKLLVDGTINIFKDCTVKRLQFSYIDDNTNEQTLWFDIPAGQTTNQYALNKNTSIFSSSGTPLIFAADKTYSITVKLIDDYSVITTTIDVQKAEGYFNIEKYGVAVGGIAHGKENDKQFECYYPMYFYDKDGNKYRIIIGENNVLMASPVSSGGGGGTTENSLIIYSDAGNLSYENSTLTYINGVNTYNWKTKLTNSNVSATLSLNKEIVITAGSSSSSTYNGNVALDSTIIIPSAATKLSLSYSVRRPSGAELYLYYGFISSGVTNSSPISGVEQGTKCIKTVELTSTTTAIDTLDLTQYNWLLGSSYIPIVMFNARSNSAYAKLTVNKIWFE